MEIVDKSMADGVKWPSRLVIVRHGQSELNFARDIANVNDDNTLLNQFLKLRDQDVNLTDEGFRQASETGKHLSSLEPFDIAFTSPYTRCVQTAEAIAKQFPYQVKILRDNRIREKDFGWLHGLTKKQIMEKYPDEFEAYNRDGKYWHRPPGGENFPDVEQRVHSFLDKLHRDHAGKKVLVVTHQTTAMMFRSLFEHLSEEEFLKIDKENEIRNCGITSFEIDFSRKEEGRLKLTHYNQIAY